MTSRFNMLMHGEPAEAANILGSGDCSQAELHAVIANALNRIATLEAPPPATAECDPPGAMKIDKVCEECGSSDISFEGWITWSIESQRFEVDDICDKGHHCKQCDGTTYAIDVEYKRYCIVVDKVSGDPPHLKGQHTFRFKTLEEVRTFHDGMREGAKLEEWEVSYSDEETDDAN